MFSLTNTNIRAHTEIDFSFMMNLKSSVYFLLPVLIWVASVMAVIDQKAHAMKRQSTDRLVFAHFMVRIQSTYLAICSFRMSTDYTKRLGSSVTEGVPLILTMT